MKACAWRIPYRLGAAVIVAMLTLALSAGLAPAQNSRALASSARRADSARNTLVVAMPSDMQNLDPTLSSADIPTQEMLTNVYSWLIDYKLVNQNGHLYGDPNQFVGGLAQSWTMMDNGKVVRFHLRHNLRFANGDPLNADAVKFTYDRIFGQKGVTVGLLALSAITNKDQIVKVDNYTVDFRMRTPNTLLFGNMAQFGHSILDPKVVQAHETAGDPYAHNWLATHTTGTETGPYELQSWQPGNQWVLVANPNYYGPQPKITKIIFKVIPDASTRLALLRRGAVDMTYEIATKDIRALQQDPNVKVLRFPSRFVVFLGMNSNVKPFNNVKVRQGISYAVPYHTILKDVLHGYGRQLTSPIPFGTPTHTDQFFHYTTDYAKAKQLLTQAGYPNGFSTTLTIANDVEEAKETAVWVKESLANVGITVNIQEMPSATFTGLLQKHQLGFFFFNNWISINNDPFYHLYWLFRSPCCDYTNYANPMVWRLIDKWMVSNQVATRNQVAVQLQRTIVNDATWVFLYQPDFVVALRKNVGGYAYYSSDRFTRYRLLYKTS
jgi:peptide/nickel transport system substrate-binding protein